nr:hypothetical protein Hi04_10k_c5482_00042 [uncultured bacterium]
MSATRDSTLANPDQRIADLERQVAEYKAERDEALERETASAEVLQVINSSPGDLAPVFDTVLQKALSLCNAGLGVIARFDGTGFHWVSARGIADEHLANPAIVLGGQQPSPGMSFHRLIRGENLVHIEDITADNVQQSGNPGRRRFAELVGA